MEQVLQKYKAILGFYLLFAAWTPVMWFVSSARTRYEMDVFNLLIMDWYEIIFGIFLIVGSFFSQFIIFLIKDEDIK